VPGPSRRQFLVTTAAGGAALAGGCALGRDRRCADAPPWRPEASEARLLAADREDFDLVLRGGPGSGVLRRLARPVPSELDLTRVAARMEQAMRRAEGVGLAGPQVGLGLRVATLMLGYKTTTPVVVFVRNPVIVERSDDTREGYEGCLSVPDVGGLVRRARWIRVRYETAAGQPVEAEAEGPDAVLWQHELDHLDGVLYLDRLLGELLPMDEVRRRREELERSRSEPRAAREGDRPSLLAGLALEGSL